MENLNKIKIHPSILCANHGNLAEDIKMLEKAGAYCLHMDVMDGDFVPNFGLGAETFKTVRKITNMPIDAHLMIRNPGKHVEYFRDLGADIISVHPEADPHIAATLGLIKSLGAVPGITINPGTSVETVKAILPLCGFVTVMTVNPGFAGQGFLDFTLEKIVTLGKLSKDYGFILCADGSINANWVKNLHPIGVTNFVIGTALFRENPAEMIRAYSL